MITAADTNILLDLLVSTDAVGDRAQEALEDAAASGSLVICDIVYAELCVHFSLQRDCDAFLAATAIRVEALTRAAHFQASRAWREYRKRGGTRLRILPDFLIGAHARTQATRLLTRDRGFYGELFPGLEIVDPSQGA